LKYALGVLGGLGVQFAVVHALPAWNLNLSNLLGIIAGTLFQLSRQPALGVRPEVNPGGRRIAPPSV